MPFKILENRRLTPNTMSMLVSAPRIAAAHKAGQFVILRAHEKGERIPLTVAEKDSDLGTIRLIFQTIGKSTRLLAEKKAGDWLPDVAGPLGSPTHIECYGRVICVSGGIGAAAAYPIAAAFKKVGNYVVSILGAQRADLLILEKELLQCSDELEICTDDGSRGRAGLVTIPLKERIDTDRPDFVLAVGPLPMMRAVAELTRQEKIPTMVSLNSVMIDGTGMCGGCRVEVGGHTRFTCVDGPEFDAHQIDFAVAAKRLKLYHEHEKCSLDRYMDQTKRS